MDPTLKNLIIFTAVALAGMFAHYGKSWYKGEIAGNLLDYLFRDNPRATVASMAATLSAAAAAYFGGVLDGVALKALIPLAFTTGFGLDSTFNKGGVVPPGGSGAATAAANAMKQAGFASLGLLIGMAALSMAVLSGCVGQQVNAPNKPSEDIAAARVVATAGVNTADALYLGGKLSKADATKVLQAATTVKNLLDAASAYLAANDPASAQAMLSGPIYTGALGVVSSFLAAHPAPATPAPSP